MGNIEAFTGIIPMDKDKLKYIENLEIIGVNPIKIYERTD